MAHLFMHVPKRIERLEFLLNALITCASTFSGFILTSVAILLGMTDNKVVRKIKKKGVMGELTCIYTVSLLFSAALIIFCVFAGLNAGKTNTVASCAYMAGFVLTLSFFVSVFQSGFFLIWIISLASKEVQSMDSRPTVPRGGYRFNSVEVTGNDSARRS